MLYKKVEKLFKDILYRRSDEDGSIFYFSAADFEGLQQQGFRFPSSNGHMLQGYFYFYENYIPDRLIIFEHGIGSGHRGYMKEIERLARHGYRVFAYDHTGCMESGGKDIGCVAQSLKDLNDAINNLQQTPEYQNLSISVVGHSWGGFSTMNICALHPEVKHQVALAGFISVHNMVKQIFSGFLSPFFKKIYAAERIACGKFADFNAAESLKKSKAKGLIIQSEDDKTVKCAFSFDILQKELEGYDNIRFLKLNNKSHNPNYTAAAAAYKDEFFTAYQNAVKKKLLLTEQQKLDFKNQWDWNRMTEQDEAIWEQIFSCLDN